MPNFRDDRRSSAVQSSERKSETRRSGPPRQRRSRKILKQVQRGSQVAVPAATDEVGEESSRLPDQPEWCQRSQSPPVLHDYQLEATRSRNGGATVHPRRMKTLFETSNWVHKSLLSASRRLCEGCARHRTVLDGERSESRCDRRELLHKVQHGICIGRSLG